MVGESGIILYGNTSSWEVESSLTANNLRSAYCIGYSCIAVGDKGTILYSTDGQNWTIESSPTNVQLNSVAYWNAKYWIVGNDGTILTSINGKDWSEVASGTDQNLYGIIGD